VSEAKRLAIECDDAPVTVECSGDETTSAPGDIEQKVLALFADFEAARQRGDTDEQERLSAEITRVGSSGRARSMDWWLNRQRELMAVEEQWEQKLRESEAHYHLWEVVHEPDDLGPAILECEKCGARLSGLTEIAEALNGAEERIHELRYEE
jgi:hypothetical protein